MNLSTQSIGIFLRELKRRKVVRACLFYLLACWGGLKAAEVALALLELDPVALSSILFEVAIVGFPITAIFSWFYEVSPAGITRTPPFVERRFLDNIALLDDRRQGAPLHGGPSRPEETYDWIVEIETGPLSGQRYGVEGNIILGRSKECDLTIPVPRISRQHAQFIVEGKQLFIRDLGSANGTAVNGTSIVGTVRLNHHDKVKIIEVVIRIKETLAHFHEFDPTLQYDAVLQEKLERQKNVM